MSRREQFIMIGAAIVGLISVSLTSYMAFATHSSTNAPARTIPYQGTLAENQQPVTRQETLTFELYDDPACQSAFWTEQQDVDVVDGRFAVQLGAVSAFERHTPDDPFAKPVIYLGIDVDGTPLSGCQQIVAAPKAVHADNGVPPGTVVSFAGTASDVPPGWLLCDGRGIDGSEYKQLFDAIGTAWGDGTAECSSGGCDFNLPDLRGYFLRGVDHGEGRDPGRAGRDVGSPGGNTGDAVGSVQGDANRQHYHNMRHRHEMHHSHDAGTLAARVRLTPNENIYVDGVSMSSWRSNRRINNIGTASSNMNDLNHGIRVAGTTANASTTTTGWSPDNTGGSEGESGESRPKNAYVNYIIKH